jgi:hypothetical protein
MASPERNLIEPRVGAMRRGIALPSLRPRWQWGRPRPVGPSLPCSLAARKRRSSAGWAAFQTNCNRWVTLNTAITRPSTVMPMAIWADCQGS